MVDIHHFPGRGPFTDEMAAGLSAADTGRALGGQYFGEGLLLASAERAHPTVGRDVRRGHESRGPNLSDAGQTDQALLDP